MVEEEKLSTIFNKISQRHGLINSLVEMKFITEHNVLEIHCVDLIERIKDVNVTKISKAFRMTRGAISKLIKRLIKAGIIEAYQKPENKKEIYYKLTDTGRTIFLKHEEMHKDRISRDSLLFSQLSENEKNSLLEIFEKIDVKLKKELENMGIDDTLSS